MACHAPAPRRRPIRFFTAAPVVVLRRPLRAALADAEHGDARDIGAEARAPACPLPIAAPRGSK